MEITDVRIRLSSKAGSRVKAFATITLDDAFVVRDMRIIEGRNGLFIAMPSRPLKEPCPKCGYRNPVRGKFCAGCGSELTMDVSSEVDDKSLHRDVAHPITQEMRDYIHNKIIEAYKLELEKGPSEEGKAAEVEQPEQKERGKEAKTEEESSEEVPPIIEKEEKTEAEEETPEVEKPEEESEKAKEEEQPEEKAEEEPTEETEKQKETEEEQKEEKTEEEETPEVEQPEEEKSGEESEEAKEEEQPEEKESGEESEEAKEEKKDE